MASASQLTRPRLEQIDDRLRMAHELAQQRHNWAINAKFGLRDRYLRGILHVGLRHPLRPQAQYGFVWTALDISGVIPDGLKVIRLEVSGKSEFGGDVLRPKQPGMLAGNVEIVERVQEVIPSLVRFQRFKDAPMGTI